MKLSKAYLIWTIIVCVFAIAINAYIIMHACLDAAASTEASSGVVEVTEEVINTVAPGTITPENHDSFVTFIRKAFGHFGLFMVSGLLSSLAIYLSINPFRWSKHYMAIVFSLEYGLLMGLLTELIQLGVLGRSGELLDVLIDFSGYLLGFLIILLVVFLILKHKGKKEKLNKECID